MSEEAKYYDRDGDLFRGIPGKPFEIYQGGWGPYSGDGFKVRSESDIIDEAEANKMIAENDARWEEVRSKQKKAA